jgi:archaemetzincin
MIHLLPMGEVGQAVIESLASHLEETFSVPVIFHEPFGLPASSYDATRHQHVSTPILKSLARFKSSLTQVERVLGIVDADLYASDLNFVFGEADPKEGVAVISLTRLRPQFYGLSPDEALFHERMLKEAVHELGHTYGLGHCANSACVMHFSNSLKDTDVKEPSFCPKCHSHLTAARSFSP